MRTIYFQAEQSSEERFDLLRAALKELGVWFSQVMFSSNQANLDDSELNPVSIMKLNEITITLI